MSIYLTSLSLGLLSGLLINYLSDCLPHRRRVARPLCNFCGKNLSFSTYLFILQCASCGRRRRLRSVIVYWVSVLMVHWIQVYPVRLDFWSSLIIFVVFGVITVIDIEYRVVLYETVIVSGGIFLTIGIVRHGALSTLLGGTLGFLVMFLFYWFGKFIVKIRKKSSSTEEEALGFGDVNLFAVLGLLLGFPAIFVSLWIAIFSAGIFSLAIIVRMLLMKQYRSDMAIPYAPFLVFGAFALLYLIRPY